MSRNKKTKKIIIADRASGMEAVAFAMSICAQVIKIGNQRVKFKFPLWAFSVPAGSRHGVEWIDDAGFKREADRILAFIQEPGGLAYFRGLRQLIIKEGDALEKTAQELVLKLKILDDKALLTAYKIFMKQYGWAYGPGIVTFLYESILSDRLMVSLSERDPHAADYLPTLMKSPYVSFMMASEQALARVRRASQSRQQEVLINEYIHDFFYIRTNYWQAPEVSRKFVLEQLQEISRKKERVVKIPKRMKLKKWERSVVELLKISEAIHDKRKQINIIGSYMMFRFLDEAVRRRKIKLPLAKRAFWTEYGDLLYSPEKILPRLKNRLAFSVGYDRSRIFYLDYLAMTERPEKANPSSLAGTPAAAGLYEGTVRRVMSKPDFQKFRPGDVLVAAMTRPDFLPIMKRAGAIITDEGGLTCHAAIVARELKIPCIVGLKNATRRLKDGDRVEVDANHGFVKIL